VENSDNYICLCCIGKRGVTHRLWKNKWEKWNQQEGSLKRLKTSAPEVLTSSEAPHQKHISSEVMKMIKSWRSSEAERIKALKRLFKGFKSRLSLQKTRRMKQREIQMDLKSFNAYSWKRIKKRTIVRIVSAARQE